MSVVAVAPARPTTGDISRWLASAGPIPVVRSERVVEVGVPATDRYVEAYWLPHIGTIGFVILRRLDALAACSAAMHLPPPTGVAPFETSMERLCDETGVPRRSGAGPSGCVTRAVARLIQPFGLVDMVDGRLAVPALVPRLTADQVVRLPEHLRSSHRLWEGRS